MAARSIFVGGTTSHAGKSWMTAAICRFLKNRGMRVAPFKAQNMSNNSSPAVNGGEIGRAQAAQAAACGLAPHTDMNPILLKPHSDCGSQVVVHGRVWQDLSATAYYEHFDYLREQALGSFERLANTCDIVVIEGAGSVAEVNLRSRDLVNFGFARLVGARALLVADIDRGGVFASLIGTKHLLHEEELPLLRSFAVNRFRGDRTLFHDGVQFLERAMDRPCLGVFPWAHDIRLDEEDGVSIETLSARGNHIAILRLPRISNLTDFERLEADWIGEPVRLMYSHVIIPGTKNTTGDLAWLRARGLDEWILRQQAAGALVIGVCGGYQMMGQSIVEAERTTAGLGLLPVQTTMLADKTVQAVTACVGEHAFRAYEIHVGQTTVPDDAEPFARVNGQGEGIRVGRCFGTYLHDAFRADVVLESLGIAAKPAAVREQTYDQLAEWFARNADVRMFEEQYL